MHQRNVQSQRSVHETGTDEPFIIIPGGKEPVVLVISDTGKTFPDPEVFFQKVDDIFVGMQKWPEDVLFSFTVTVKAVATQELFDIAQMVHICL